MKRVSIRGTIVDAWFDAPFFAAEIEAGIITPVTRFRAALEEALAAEDPEGVEIEINSVGGDVFAGGEMLAAMQDAGDKIARVTVGGIAASMAANIAIMAARPLAVHSNSLLFFHSATSEIWGGPGAHEDEAAMLEKINAPMIARLIAAGVDEERVRTGFSDGRSMVLGAEEAARYLGAEIIGGDAPAPKKPDDETRAKMERGDATLERLAEYTATMRRVARLAAWTPEAPAHEAAHEAAEGTAAQSEVKTPEARAALESLEKQLRAVQSGAAKKIASLTARVATLESERDGALAELAEIKTRAESLAASLERERTARAALVGGVTGPEADVEMPISTTPFSDRMAALRTVDERLEYAREHRRELAMESAMMQNKTKQL